MRGKLPTHPTRKYNKRPKEQVKYLVLHCTDADWTLEQLAEYNINPNHISSRGCPELTYNTVIMPDGKIYHCVDFDKVTWHAGKWNPESIAVALMYKTTNPHGRDFKPPQKEIDSFLRLAPHLCLKLGINPENIKGHRELKDTGWVWKVGDRGKATKQLVKWCPGKHVPMEVLRYKICRKMQFKMKAKGFYQDGEIDGIWGPKSEKAMKEYRNAIQ